MVAGAGLLLPRSSIDNPCIMCGPSDRLPEPEGFHAISKSRPIYSKLSLRIVPGLLLVFGGMVMPGSPRYLVAQGKPNEALKMLLKLRSQERGEGFEKDKRGRCPRLMPLHR